MSQTRPEQKPVEQLWDRSMVTQTFLDTWPKAFS